MALCLLSICGPVTKHGPLFLWLSDLEARGTSCVAKIVRVLQQKCVAGRVVQRQF